MSSLSTVYHNTHLVVIVIHLLTPLVSLDTPDPEGQGSGSRSLAAVWVTLVAPSLDED